MEPDLQDPYRGRLLVVDDEEPVVQLLGQWLADEGYSVRQALSFGDVQGAMQEAPFDLVTLDIMMPGVDGLEILQWLREHYPQVGVVMATAVSDLGTVLEALRAGATNYLLKPFNLELVSEQVARAMERQRLIAENQAYQSQMEKKVQAQLRSLREVNEQLQEANAGLQRRLEELERRAAPGTGGNAHRAARQVQGDVGQALAHMQRAKAQVDHWVQEEGRDDGR